MPTSSRFELFMFSKVSGQGPEMSCSDGAGVTAQAGVNSSVTCAWATMCSLLGSNTGGDGGRGGITAPALR